MNNLQRNAAKHGIALDAQMLERFSTYEELLLDWNTRINLTAITDHEEILTKHFLDSLLLLNAIDLPQGALVIDVGTGAGFPGIPLKIVRPDIQLTLLDSLQKRVHFLQTVCEEIGFADVQCIHARAEDAGRMPEYRERYTLACARAVASLPSLAEYCLPFVQVGGLFAAMKGPQAQEELEQAKYAIACLGAKADQMVMDTLPGGDQRSLVLIKKISQTSAKYPRKGTKIAKNPLAAKK